MVLTSTKGQQGLPRYFSQVFETVQKINTGRVDFNLPDGRVFRAEGKNTDPVTSLEIKDNDLFARLIRKVTLDFAKPTWKAVGIRQIFRLSWIGFMRTMKPCTMDFLA